MGIKRGQASFEYILGIGIFLAITVIGVAMLLSANKESETDVGKSLIVDFSSSLIESSTELYYSGSYGKREIYFNVPPSVNRIYALSGNNLIFSGYNKSREYIIHSVYSRVALKIAGFDDPNNMPTKFILIKDPAADYVLVCSADTCESMYCPDNTLSVTYCYDPEPDGIGDPNIPKESCIGPPPGYVRDCSGN